MSQPRLSVRGLVVQGEALLLVNATPDFNDGKWCLPGGGIEKGEDLKTSLQREIHEETGISVDVQDACVIHEFCRGSDGFHQIDLFFTATVAQGMIDEHWSDPAGVVVHRGFFTLPEIQQMDVFPAFLKEGKWLDRSGAIYKGMERS